MIGLLVGFMFMISGSVTWMKSVYGKKCPVAPVSRTRGVGVGGPTFGLVFSLLTTCFTIVLDATTGLRVVSVVGSRPAQLSLELALLADCSPSGGLVLMGRL